MEDKLIFFKWETTLDYIQMEDDFILFNISLIVENANQKQQDSMILKDIQNIFTLTCFDCRLQPYS